MEMAGLLFLQRWLGVHYLLHHLDRSLVAVLFKTRHCGDNHKDGKPDKNQAHTFVKNLKESIGYYALQERCKLAFKDVHTKSGRQHASKEQVTLADRYVALTANQYCYKRRPIEPDDRIEEVECQATQVNTQALRSLHIAEVYLVCLACLGSVAGFKEHRIKAETGHNACANVYNPTIVEQQDHLLHRYVS